MRETQVFLNYYLKGEITPLVVDGIIGRMSNAAIKLAINKLVNLFQQKQYRWNTTNLIAIRTNDIFTNSATDWFILVEGNSLIAVPCTTKAGRFWVYNPITTGGITGTANLVENQYRDTYRFVTSSNWRTLWLQTPYFHQIRPVTVYRDNTRDNKLDRIQEHTGLFGINIHTGGWNSIIDKWSAGCIVIPRKYWLPLLPKFKSGQIYDFTLLNN